MTEQSETRRRDDENSTGRIARLNKSWWQRGGRGKGRPVIQSQRGCFWAVAGQAPALDRL